MHFCMCFFFFLHTQTLKTTLSKGAASQHPSLAVAGVPQHLVHGGRGIPLQWNSHGQGGSTAASALQDLWHVPHFGGWFRLRSGLPPLLRGQPGGPCLHCQPTLGSAPPSVVCGLHSCWLCAAWLLLPESTGRQVSCPQLTALLGRGEDLESNWSTTPRSRLTRTLVRTLPPASRQILAATFSREPSTPQRPTQALQTHFVQTL